MVFLNCLCCSKKNRAKTEEFLYFLNIFKSNVHSKPSVPKIIIMMGTDLSSFISSLKVTRYHKPKIITTTETIKPIIKNNFGCFFSNSSKYGFVLKAISSPPWVYYSIYLHVVQHRWAIAHIVCAKHNTVCRRQPRFVSAY